MHPVTSPGLPTTAAQRAARVRFRRALALMAMTLVVPGSAQLVAGNRRAGVIALRIWMTLVALVLGTLLLGVVWHELLFWIVSTPWELRLLWLGLILAAVGWAGLFIDAWRIGQPLTLSMGHRRTAVAVNGLLCFSVASVLLFSAHLVGVQRDFMLTLFGSHDVSGAHDGRYNVLLLGGDSGSDRWGLRPDSMTVASIDAKTGKTVLVGLPRNMENFRFAPGSTMHRQFPKGWLCADGSGGEKPNGDSCYLNGLSTWAQGHTDLFPGVSNPGVEATIEGIEGVTGLKINYWAMVNLQGFSDLVDAVGGVKLNVRQAIPVGGLGTDVTGYIKPGVRTLDGHDTLWFARARDDSDDYSRMARQKCVMNAMLHQISPQQAVTHFEDIARASSAMISTDIPASEVDRFISLALKAKGQPISTLSLVPPMINTAHPDIALIHRTVRHAIDPAPAPAKASQASASGTPAKPVKHHRVTRSTTVTGGSLGSRNSGYAANDSTDLSAAC